MILLYLYLQNISPLCAIHSVNIIFSSISEYIFNSRITSYADIAAVIWVVWVLSLVRSQEEEQYILSAFMFLTFLPAFLLIRSFSVYKFLKSLFMSLGFLNMLL